MTVAIALLFGAAIVSVAAPALLRHLAARAVDPLCVIVGWLLGIGGVLGTVVVALTVMARPGTAAGSPLARLVDQSWWYAVKHAPSYVAYHAVAWLAAATLVAAGLRLAWVVHRETGRRSAHKRAQLDVLRLVGTAVPGRLGGPATLLLQSDRAVAFSFAGRPGTVVVTEGLCRRIPAAGVNAVLAHERAHLRGRHHLIVACTEILATAFPIGGLLRAAPAAMRELVELAADTEAVRACGPAALRTALLSVTRADSSCTPDAALAMARTAVDVRLRHLDAAAAPSSGPARFTRCGGIAVMAMATPLLATVALLGVVSLLATAFLIV